MIWQDESPASQRVHNPRRSAEIPSGSPPNAYEEPSMARQVDALIAATLKNVREQWWDAAFSEFLQETLRPRPGNRILDVGSGEGTAELGLGRMQVSQLKLVAIDKNFARVSQTAAMGRSHNHRLALAAADATRLPF